MNLKFTMVENYFKVTECYTGEFGDANGGSTQIIRAESIKDVVKYLRTNVLKNERKRDRELMGLGLWESQVTENGMKFTRDIPEYSSYNTYEVKIEPLKADVDLMNK